MQALRIALLALVAAAPAAAAEPINLDSFLGGFETRCSGPAAFVRYRDSLGERYTTSGSLKNRVALPPGLEEAFGRELVIDRGEYVSVTVPLAGTYKGLPVSQLEFELGNENGIYTVAIVFSAPYRNVQAAIGSAVARAQRELRSELPGRHPVVELRRNRGLPKLVCNLSD